jgi:excisionase family DNA binding protein
MDDIELMDVKASADYLRVSTSFLYQLVSVKKIKHIRIGSKIMFTKQILNEFLLSKIVEGGNNERKGIYL